ncbi:MAG: hypothetical protein ACYC4L_09500 [Chloroflexota bacterium]
MNLPRTLLMSLSLALALALLVAVSPLTTPSSNAATTDTVAEMWLTTNDIVYDTVSQRLYASVPSSYGTLGNSVVTIDPILRVVTHSVWVGSEPSKLALSDDGQYLYVALDGTASVARLVMSSQTVDLRFGLGSDDFFGPYYVEDMAVLPGAPHSVAIARKNLGISPRHAGVAVYDDGVQRPTATARHTGSNAVAFSDAADLLYGYNNETTEFGFRRMNVDASGVTVADTTGSLISGFDVDLAYDGGLVYATSGAVVDPERLVRVGTFPNVGYGALVEPDSSVGRVFFLAGTGDHRALLVFDQRSMEPVGSIPVDWVIGTPSSLTRWGADGLAFRTDNGQVFLIRSDLIAGGNPPTPTPVPTVTQSPTPKATATLAPPTPTATPAPTATPTPVPTLHIGDLDAAVKGTRNLWGATVTIFVHDSWHQPVSGATVTGHWAGAYAANTWCTTGANGFCSVTSSNRLRKNDSLVFTVDGVTHGWLVYQSNGNHDPDLDSDGTRISVRGPQ